MIKFDDPEVASKYQEAFGSTVAELTTQQLWWLVNFGKHVRGRCRSNTALNNYLNRNFGNRFTEIPKEYQGRSYKGLKIDDDSSISSSDE